MNTSYNWIKSLVPGLHATEQEFADAMTLSGTKCEGYSCLDKNLENIVVGRILKIDPHPDANKLIVCSMDVGQGSPVQIVTGADNVREGDYVPVVLDGGKVAGGHDGGPLPENGIKIKAGKLRGVESNGMLCAIEELGRDRNYYPGAPENGIYILYRPGDDGKTIGSDNSVELEEGVSLKPGDDALEFIGLHDAVFEYEITSNRVDCYSILGIAREAAATFDLPFTPPEVSFTESAEKTEDMIKVTIRDPELCSRYIARICTDVKIAPSPKWMQKRLAAQGIRPINNLVDITNYVMLEYGQPMHAFDLSTVAGGEIIVRRAKDGEEFTTLDGQVRQLDHDVCMICDRDKEIAIGGIMGGENSMITDSVKTVLFEAATFNGANIRKSAKRIGLRTDASSFFEKGLDPNNARAAIDRACQLMELLGAGKPAAGCVDAHGELPAEKKIAFEPEKINHFLGTDISREDMLEYLNRVEIRPDKDGMLTVPTFRQDVLEFADIAEEVARFYGYDKIPVSLPRGEAVTGGVTEEKKLEDLMRSAAQFAGYSQAETFSFESPKVFDRLLLAETDPLRKAVEISNPLGEDFSIMRTSTVNGMLMSLSVNYNRRNKNVRLYELGRVYLPGDRPLPLTELPDERTQMTLGFYGSGDFFDLKGTIEELLDLSGVRERAYVPGAGGFYGGKPEDGAKLPYLHPGRQALILAKGAPIGYLGEVHPKVAKAYEIGERAFLAVLDLKSLLPLASFDKKYAGVPRFPAITRDLSMTVPRNILVGEIEALLKQRGGKLLESCVLFDVYEGEQVKEGYKSVAYSCTFRASDRTLEDEDVQKVMKKILEGLGRMGIELRQ